MTRNCIPHLEAEPPVFYIIIPYKTGDGKYPNKLKIICAHDYPSGRKFFGIEHIIIPVIGGIKQAPKNKQSHKNTVKYNQLVK